MTSESESTALLEEFLAANGRDLCQALHLLLSNVTEPTVVRYALARIDYLLPDGSKLRKRVEYFTQSGVVDAAPYLRLVRSAQGYVEHAAGHILAKMLSAKPNETGIKAMVDWVVQSLSLGKDAVQLVDPVRAASARAAVSALMALLRNERARWVFTRANGLKLYVLHSCRPAWSRLVPAHS